MKKIKGILIVLLPAVLLIGCSGKNDELQKGSLAETEETTEIWDQSIPDIAETSKETDTIDETNNIVDYSEYFQGISGCAVIYDEPANAYYFYNKEQCEIEVSPLSTFKIVSALIGLEKGVLTNENTTMEYSGMEYPVENWNGDLTLKEAFDSSCVWYFRQVIDKVGQKDIIEILNELHYGNCDISEWNGSNVNSLAELNGFWIESSLKISPIQQVQMLSYIFSSDNSFSIEHLEILKNVMYVTEFEDGGLYGKTGSATEGMAWFVGFTEKNEERRYFAIYLDDVSNKDIVSGSKAREIAVDVLSSTIKKIEKL